MIALPHNIPAFRITLAGKDLTDKFKPRQVSVTLTENRGDDADQLDIVIEDTDGKLEIPKRGVQIGLQIGWVDDGLVDKGKFTVDEVQHDGAPDKLTLRARSASLIDTFRTPQEFSYHDTTLGKVIEQIATRHELKPGISATLAKEKISHVDQTHESDAAFLRRLGRSFDAVATVKNNTLIFAPAGQGKTVSGKELPTQTIVRRDGDLHNFHTASRDTYTGVRAYWHDPKAAKKKSVVAGLSGNLKQLRTTYATEADAQRNAKAEWERIKRGEYTFSLTLALGNATLTPEMPIKVSGWKKQIDDIDWIATRVVHSIADKSFTTQIEQEMKPAALR